MEMVKGMVLETSWLLGLGHDWLAAAGPGASMAVAVVGPTKKTVPCPILTEQLLAQH